ncbi:primosomal protein N' [Paenibacillus thailandensis]|uniref:Replication restart protein PriA n=1 Tax=Paenibacillus thailandensis TaxID=393250 RepID=A0ABW5QXC7_9BACL
MIAKVIVDVPSRQTDRPFDYAVPRDMEPWIEPGSRVGVPFGGRVLQGFVIGLADESEFDAKRIKPVAELLDPVPPLLPDLIELARWMSDKYVCTWIAALQAMVPSALKGKAERFVTLSNEAPDDNGALSGLPEELLQWLNKDGGVKLDVLLGRFPHYAGAVKQALKAGMLEEKTSIHDRVGIRKVLTVYPPEGSSDPERLFASLPARAGKQRELLAYILRNNEPIPLQRLLAEAGGSAGSVRALADKGLVTIREEESKRDPYAGREFKRTEPLPLTPGQQDVYGRIAGAVESPEPKVMLLHGVTGSGKTEVYLQAIHHCLTLGKQAIVLVPEISLTPQMVERFKGRFGDAVAVMHSRLSHGERYDEWRKIRSGAVQVAIGARSAVFAPFERIGLIIIDEEHESSYKQEETPKYHARDVAVKRAKQHGAAVVLGSATPSLESYAAASRTSPGGESMLLPMPERVHGGPLPPVRIVDMRGELMSGNRSMFSRSLHQALEERLARGEQSVLLLNRRGYSTFVMCRSCGYSATCPHCDISLTYHRKSGVLRCHYCGHAEPLPASCPSCGSEHIRYFGTGTQRVEEELAKLFPGIRVIRMDVDTTSEKNAHEKLLKQFGDREADVLLGTQMVAKGLDFPYVTLVGVIAADTSLNLPDFRAGERTFQLLTQVAGRAGRHHLPGEVIIQTYAPEHYAIAAAQRHDYAAFLAEELKHRSLLAYPPYCRLVLVTMSHEQIGVLAPAAEQFAGELRALAGAAGYLGPLDGGRPKTMEVLGPTASPIAKMKDRYRFQCVIKYRGNIDISSMLRAASKPLMEAPAGRQAQISIDIDPQMIL